MCPVPAAKTVRRGHDRTVDCDDAILLIAERALRTLTGREIAQLTHHCEVCETCTEVRARNREEDDWVWVARVPEDALDDPDMLTFPTIDPALYEELGPIGRGGMGRIIKARDRRLGRIVAIKELLDDSIRSRFEREATITSQLQHPAIVPIYEAGTWPDGSLFYTMRLVEGEALSDEIRNRETLIERLSLLPNLISACDAVGYAHSQGVIHRDLKPHNILVGEHGETVVIDWGLAKVMADPHDDAMSDLPSAVQRELTMAGEVLGTPCYIAPEQAAGGRPDERSDVYSLGAILYALLAGTHPLVDRFPDATGRELVDLSMTESPTPIARLAPTAPTELHAICERAMASTAAERYPSARELAQDLRRLEAGQLVASKQYTVPELISRWIKMHRAAVTVGGLGLVALIIVGVMAVVGIANQRSVAEQQRNEAIEARQSSEQRALALVFYQAKEKLRSDPTHAIAWLRRYPQDGPLSQGAGVLVAEALRLGVHRDVFDSPTYLVDDLRFEGDDFLLATAMGYAARVWKLSTGSSHELTALASEYVYYDTALGTFFSTDRDGARLVYQGIDMKAHDGKLLGEGQAGVMKYSPDTRVAALALKNQQVVLWNESTKQASVLQSAGWPMGFVERGTRLVSHDDDADTLVLWDVASGVRVAEYALPAKVSANDFLALPRSSTNIAVRKTAKYGAAVLDLTTERLHDLAVGTPISALAFSADGSRLALGTRSGQVIVFDPNTRTEVCRWTADSGWVSEVQYAHAGRVLAVGTRTGGVVIAGDCGAIERRLLGHTEKISVIAFSDDDRLVATASEDQSIRVFDRQASRGENGATVAAPIPSDCVAEESWVYPRGGTNWFLCERKERDDHNRYARVRDEGVERFEHGSGHGDLALVSGDGSTIAVQVEAGTLVWRDGKEITVPAQFGSKMEISWDGRRLSRPTENGLEIWSVDEARQIATLPHVVEVAVPSPDDSLFAVETSRGIAVVDSEGVVAAGDGHILLADQISWSRDSKYVGFAFGRTVMLFDRLRERWHRLHSPYRLDDANDAIAVASAGVVVGAGADRRRVIVWDVQTGVYGEHELGKDVSNHAVTVSEDGSTATLHTASESVVVTLSPFSTGSIEEATRAAIDDRGDARTP